MLICTSLAENKEESEISNVDGKQIMRAKRYGYYYSYGCGRKRRDATGDDRQKRYGYYSYGGCGRKRRFAPNDARGKRYGYYYSYSYGCGCG
uniref:Uncharacterized protein n=1 Tax=Acrobeloides nanus TaxID=290746 RepID=A0A914C704_9BILA